jgi:hypothetical protein
VAGNVRGSGGKGHGKRRGADACNHPVEDDLNNDAKPKPEEAEE